MPAVAAKAPLPGRARAENRTPGFQTPDSQQAIRRTEHPQIDSMIDAITIERASEAPRQSRLFMFITPGALLAIGLALGWLYQKYGYRHKFSQGIAGYIALFVLQFGLYLLACYFVLRSERPAGRTLALVTSGIVVVFGGVFRAELAGKPPYLSTDVYRYVWDGNVQSHGINPYRYRPTATELSGLRDSRVFPKINGADYEVTPYPPVAEMIFLVVDLISPLNVTAFKIAIIGFDMITVLATMLVLARARIDPSRAVVFAWHPLVIWEGSHSGHVDSAFIACIAVCLLAWTYERHAIAGIALGAATLIKFYPIILLPAFLPSLADKWAPLHSTPQSSFEMLKETGVRLRRAFLSRPGLTMIVSMVVTIGICYLPYLAMGRGMFGYLTEYFEEEGFTNKGGRYFLLALGRKLMPIPTEAYTAVAMIALGALGLVWVIKTRRGIMDVARGSIAIIGLSLLLTSPRYSWYYCWIVPFLCFDPRPGWLYLTGATVLLYTLWFIPNEYPNLPLWLGAALYAPTLVMLALDRFKKANAGAELAYGET